MKIFLLHVEGDQLAKELQVELEGRGHEVQVDRGKPQGNSGQADHLDAVIRDSDLVIFLISRDLCAQPERAVAALRVAEGCAAVMLPVFQHRVRTLPDSLDRLALGRRVELFSDFEMGLDQLLVALDGVRDDVPEADEGVAPTATTESGLASKSDEPSLRELARQKARRARLRYAEKREAHATEHARRKAAGRTIFLSYSRRDDIAVKVQRQLEAHGHDVWRDQEDIGVGDDWRASIEKAIRASDVFVILVSPSLVNRPDHAKEELGFARKHNKQIVPVYVQRVKELPPGFDLVLGGKHRIDLSEGFTTGINALIKVVGDSGPESELTIFDRARREQRRVRAFAEDKHLGKNVKRYGGMALAGAAAGVAIAVKAQSEVQGAQYTTAMERYRDEVGSVLTDIFREVQVAMETEPSAYGVQSQPKIQRMLGRLESMQSPNPKINERHSRLVRDVRRLLMEFDETMARIAIGREDAAQLAFERTLSAYADTVDSFRRTVAHP